MRYSGELQNQIGGGQKPDDGELRSGAAALVGTIAAINAQLDDLERRLYQPTPKAAVGGDPNAPPPGLPSIEVALNRANQGLDVINGRLATMLERL